MTDVVEPVAPVTEANDTSVAPAGPTEEELQAALKKTALLEDTEEQILFSCNICYDVRFLLMKLAYLPPHTLIYRILTRICRWHPSPWSHYVVIYIAGRVSTVGCKCKAIAAHARSAKPA